MRKEIQCGNCKALLAIDGPVQGTRVSAQSVTCPDCVTPNEVMWPIQSGAYTVTLIQKGSMASGSESEDILL